VNTLRGSRGPVWRPAWPGARAGASVQRWRPRLRRKAEDGSAGGLILRLRDWAETDDVEPIRVLLVDDQSNVRRGLTMRLSLEPDIEVVGEAADGKAAVEAAQRLQPSVVLMDVEMPELDGIAATTEIRTALPRTAVVILTLHDDAATRARAEAAGAASFVPKHRMDGVLLDAIRRAAGRAPSG
jgi:CheY-like chemotaxis protein